MTEKMDQIQQGLVECMEATLSEVRRHQSAMVSKYRDQVYSTSILTG